MTDPGRYDRPDPCDDCGQPHRGDCPLDPWAEEIDFDALADRVRQRANELRALGYPDDWDPDDLGLRVVRDLRTGGDRL